MRVAVELEKTGEFKRIVTTNGLAGWIRKDMPEELFADFIRDPDACFNHPSHAPLKNGPRAKVVKETLKSKDGATRDVVIKRFHRSSFWRRMGALFSSSGAVRSLKGALVLESAGVGTAPPFAAFECRDWEHLGMSYCISEEVKDSQSLPAFWRAISVGSSTRGAFQKKREVLREVAAHFHRLHSRDIYHQDLKGENILIRRSNAGKSQYFFIDVDGVWKGRRLSQAKKVKNLAQLYRTLGKLLNITNKVFFLNCYAELFSMSRRERRLLARRVLAVSRREDLKSMRRRARRRRS